MRITFVFLLCAVFLKADTITIAVAANVSYAIEKLKSAFHETNPDINVRVILGSSGKLTAQIKNGAPYQLFMSANMKYPNSLYRDKTAATKPIVYAQGALALFSARKRDFSDGIRVIKKNSISKIAVANPKTAPYGRATIEAIKNAKLYEETKNKYTFAESITQTVQYATVATDIGFIAKSSLYSPKMSKYKKDTNWIEIDPKLYTPIKQGIVILEKGKNNDSVKAFYDFILSKKAKGIFEEFGYMVDYE